MEEKMKNNIFFLLVVILMLNGCLGSDNNVMKQTIDPKIFNAKFDYKPPTNNEGSLWPGDSIRSGMLFQDRKARYLGDTITVVISEDISAVGKADTNSEATNENYYSIPYIWGQSATNYHNKDWSNFLKTKRENSFKGKGTVSRSNKMSAKITAQVVQVLPNGNLQIAGKKFITINGQQQYILLTGTIRPDDIKADNTVMSEAIANAQIEYSGKGILSAKQKRGWASVILDLIWPF